MAGSSAATPYSLQTPEWLAFLRTLCALAESAAELAKQAPESSVAACVSAVLADPQRRIAVMGTYGGAVTRFLEGFRGGFARAIATPGVKSVSSGMAVSADGSLVLVSDFDAHVLNIFSVCTGELLRNICNRGVGPSQLLYPCQVWVASDGFVFVADSYNDRIQILTPCYDFHACVGVGQLRMPTGVCANDDVIVVSERDHHKLNFFHRHTGALIRRIWSGGSRDMDLQLPAGVCFMTGNQYIAVADFGNRRVSVRTLSGVFSHNVGVGRLKRPKGVACSAANELVVADFALSRVMVFSARDEIVWTSSTVGSFTGVAIHGSTIFGQTARDGKCHVFT